MKYGKSLGVFMKLWDLSGQHPRGLLQTMKFQTALRLKLENFLYWSWTLATFNSLILRLDWK